METMRMRAIQNPGDAEVLLDSFVRQEGHLPRDVRRLVKTSELTPSLEKLAHRSLDDGYVWRAWTDDRAMWMWIGEMSLARSRERGLPVMEVWRYDEFAQMEERGTFVRVSQDRWQRCNE
jgi:hypothetical protein